jgi:catechol 2,3-dioxygenase-like lactoylglutathione lyase family enzyme
MLGDAPFIGFVPVASSAEARAFYEGVLGLTVVEDTPFALVVEAGGTLVRLTPVETFTAQPFTIAGWKVADITATAETLTARGIPFNRYDGLDQDDLGIWTAPGGDRVAWFSDPFDNTLSLTTFAGH